MLKTSLDGKEFDGFRILGKIGEGGMGDVYKAEDINLEQHRAIKVLKPVLGQDELFMKRFCREAKELARLHHPNIVIIFGFRSDPEIGSYIIMEYVDGITLNKIIKQAGVMSHEEAIPTFKQLLKAVSYAHKKNLIHRDIKPSNVMLTNDNIVKLTDFGLAKNLEQDKELTLTGGAAIGTLFYMPPEQIRNSTSVDYRSDIYSLGITLYEMLVGQTPFADNDSLYSIQTAIIQETPPAPNKVRSNIPQSLSEIVMKSIDKIPKNRYQSVDEMLDAIDSYQVYKDTETVRIVNPKNKKIVWSKPMPKVVLGLLIIIIMGIGAFSLIPIMQGNPSDPPIEPTSYIFGKVEPERINRKTNLALAVVPYGSISVNGVQQANNSAKSVFIEMISEGENNVIFSHPEFGEKKVIISASIGNVANSVICYFKYSLNIEVTDTNSNPLSANIFINNQQLRQKSPISAYTLYPGEYEIKVRHTGFQSRDLKMVLHPTINAEETNIVIPFQLEQFTD